MVPKPITTDDFESMQDPDFNLRNGSEPRRKNSKRAELSPAEPKSREAKAKPTPMIILTPERVSKLWNILCGGRLVIEDDSDHGGIICHVSRDSFDSLLEGMIDRL